MKSRLQINLVVDHDGEWEPGADTRNTVFLVGALEGLTAGDLPATFVIDEVTAVEYLGDAEE